MNNNITKHDTQTVGSSNSSTATTNCSGKVSSNKEPEICRDFAWGKCLKGYNCRHQHVFDIEKIKKTVVFCHDWQNGKPCKKVPCNYIHTSEEEQKMFHNTGKIPKALRERYDNMLKTTGEIIPQMAMYNKESIGCPPHPPLTPALQTSNSSTLGPQQTYNMGHIAPVMSMGSMHPVAMNMGPILPPNTSMSGPSTVPPPPPTVPTHHLPPPPPPPTQSSTSSMQSTPPKYTAPPPPAVRLPPKHPPTPGPLKYDPSKPPPPLPNATTKRTAVNNDLDAGPSKMRKEVEANVDDARCDVCQQRQIRIDALDKDLEKMFQRCELQNIIYKKKLEAFQQKENILKHLLSPEVYKLINECLEDGSQLQDSINQNPIPSDRVLLAQMIKYFVGTDRSHSTSPLLEETLRTFMSRPNPNNTIQNSSLSLREFMREGNKKREEQPSVNGTSNSNNAYTNHNPKYKADTQPTNSQSSIVSTSKTQISLAGTKTTTTTTTASTSYLYYSMPPMSRPYNMMPPQMTAVANTPMMAYQQNGMPGPPQIVPKPSTSVPPPKPNSQSTQNSVSYPPPTPTPYYNPYQ